MFQTRVTANFFSELWCCEYDTDDHPEAAPEHHYFALALESSGVRMNHGGTLHLDDRAARYLAGNLHFHIDRWEDWLDDPEERNLAIGLIRVARRIQSELHNAGFEVSY